MRNDGVDIAKCTDKISNGFQVSFIENNEWLQFTVEVKATSKFDIAIRYSSEKEGGKVYLEQDGTPISETIVLPVSGGETIWKTAFLKNISLKKGPNTIRVHFEGGNFNLNYIEFKQ